MTIDWEAVIAVGTIVSVVIVFGSVVVLRHQLQELRKATYAQSFFAASQRLQDESMRRTRSRVFRLKTKDPNTWSTDEIEDVEQVASSYDVVGIMARHGLLPPDLIVDSWGDSLRRLRPICEPLVTKYRAMRGAPEFWDDFEWLASKAGKLHQRRRDKSLSVTSSDNAS